MKLVVLITLAIAALFLLLGAGLSAKKRQQESDNQGNTIDHERFGRFISTLSHELRTPLTAALSHLQIAQTPKFDESIREASLELTKKEIQRVSHLVQELTLLSNLEHLNHVEQQPLDFVLLADEVISQMIQRAEQAQISLHLMTEDAVPQVIGEKNQLKRVFINLLDNAIKYCGPGDQVTIHFRRDNERVVCEVRDSGPGIPAQSLLRLTERLYRVRTDVEGSGLGLAISEEILQRHQSCLSIESKVEGERRGTIFRFSLRVFMQSARSD